MKILIIILILLLSSCTFNSNIYKHIINAESLMYISDNPSEDYWQTPNETWERGGGDCEDTALWLYSKLKAEGYDIRFVCGKRYADSDRYHAWTELKWYGKIYILDPAWHTYSFPREQYFDNEYIEYDFESWKDKFLDWKERTYNGLR